MRIGIMAGATSGNENLDAFVASARDFEARGFDTMWLANIFGLDAITTAAVIGRETDRIALGTAVVPSYPRHPVALAQQAVTTQAACRGRFHLGIGLSHKIVIEDLLGLSYARRARHMREYLSVLAPLLRGEPAKFEGEEFRVDVSLTIPDVEPVPTLIAALGDHMLRIAGQKADGTILWMTGPETIESHVGPRLRAAAAEAGRPAPRIVAGLPIVLTDDVEATREAIDETLVIYGQLPSYRAMLDKEGAAGPADVSLVGNESELDAQIQRLIDVGVTDFCASIVPTADGVAERTLDYLTSKLGD
ncbi:MAG TPA: TIGR03564 family F420-dependent LLM class oxidoreductase [Deltaproteobacteria bacterium]|nr:TIGR03564 family F420-dependent LLM class oxidoreductase [Deltaproteobacteria bacterium]